jgi:plastocyanin
MRARRFAALGAVVLGGLVLAGCGGDDTGDAGGGGGSGATADVVLRGNNALKWDRPTYTAAAGPITIEIVNDGTVPHTLVFAEKHKFDGTRDKLAIGPKRNDTARGTVELAAGEYAVYCDVPGHRATMTAELVVE